MNLLIGEAAYRDLAEIHDWIAKDRPVSAERVINRILNSAELLREFPFIGHSGKVPGTHEWVVTR